jgi:hypothetical protein
MGTAVRHGALLFVMMTFFAGLALDIAVPAMILSLMALLKWMVSLDFDLVMPRGNAA